MSSKALGRRTLGGVPSVLAALILIIIATSAAILLYAWKVGLIGEITSMASADLRKIKIEGVSVNGRTLTVYVRNVGEERVAVSTGYLIYPSGNSSPLSFAAYTSGTEIWGGDVWRVNPATGAVELVSSGKVIYDTFTSPNPSVWDDDYVDYNNFWSAVYYDPDGLKLLSMRKLGAVTWAVRGLITVSRMIDLSKPVVIEVDMQKTYYNVPGGDAAASPFAACLYLSPAKNRNPYYATPWFAAKLYPRPSYNPDRTEAQLVSLDPFYCTYPCMETLYIWSSAPNTQPRGTFILVFNDTVKKDKVYYYFWHGGKSGSPYRSGSWSSDTLGLLYGTQLYLYLTIDNKVTASSRKVHVRYLKVYTNTSIKVEGVQPGWVVRVVDSSGATLKEVEAKGDYVYVSLLKEIVYGNLPIEGHVVVLTYNETEVDTYGGLVIDPGEVRAVQFLLPENLEEGVYTFKVVLVTGEEAYYSFRV